MSEQNVVPNPYIVDGPVQDARLFFGRDEVFAWVLDTMKAFPPRQMMALFGPARIGKSSLLRQMNTSRLGTGILPVFVKLTRLGSESLSLFYQNLAEETLSALSRHNFEFTELDQAAFVNDPQLAFNQQVISPILVGLNGRKILFLIDDVDSFIAEMEDGYLPADTLAELAMFLCKYPQLYTIVAVNRLPETELMGQLEFLNDAYHYYLGPFEQETAVSLIREPVHFTIVREVARYIHRLSEGRPRQLQLICHALFERKTRYGLRQITVADVAAAHRGLVLRGQWDESQAARLPAFLPGNGDGDPETLTRTSLSGARGPLLWVLGIMILILIIAAVLLGWRARNGTLPGSSLATVSPPAQRATATASTLVLAAADASPTTSDTPSATPTAVATAVLTATPSATPSGTPTPAATATTTPTPTVTPVVFPPTIEREIDGMLMIYISGNTFMMGAVVDDIMAGDDERPEHRVQLTGYYIDKYEVSVGQYAAFLSELGAYERACARIDCALPRGRIGYTSYLIQEEQEDGTLAFAALPGFSDYPMNHVSWYGAKVYCEYTGSRLPTEAEWEYAARGDDGRIYPWGNEPPDKNLAVYQSQNFSDLLPVDALPDGASPFGVLGMAGSLWEWTADWYAVDYYANSPVDNPPGPVTGLGRVQRGGAWPNNNEADRIRATNRTFSEPTFISSTVGFRCVQSLPEISQ